MPVTTTILTIAAACAGVARGVVGASLVLMPRVNLLEQERDCLADILSEVAIENDLLHAERKGRVKVYS